MSTSGKQAKFPIRAKVALLKRGWTIVQLGRSIEPKRPRSTVSQAIHTLRFPKVRKQVKEALGL